MLSEGDLDTKRLPNCLQILCMMKVFFIQPDLKSTLLLHVPSILPVNHVENGVPIVVDVFGINSHHGFVIIEDSVVAHGGSTSITVL